MHEGRAPTPAALASVAKPYVFIISFAFYRFLFQSQMHVSSLADASSSREQVSIESDKFDVESHFIFCELYSGEKRPARQCKQALLRSTAPVMRSGPSVVPWFPGSVALFHGMG
jgi:hypothetical protein